MDKIYHSRFNLMLNKLQLLNILNIKLIIKYY